MEGNRYLGLLCKGETGNYKSDRSKIYIFECPYCGSDFNSTKIALKPKTGRLLGKDHCGCQTYIRRATRVGIPPANKLSDKDRTISQSLQAYTASAKTRSLDFKLERADVENLIFGNCYYCGVVPSTVRSLGQGAWKRNSLLINGIDRKNSNQGYILENVVSCCSLCNYFKSDMDFEIFCALVHKISYNLKYNQNL